MARDTLVPAGALLGDRYEVGACLGQGNLTAVHVAVDTELEIERVVRVLEPALSRTPRAREAFLAQARALARVKHPALVAVHDIGTDEDGVFLVMERLHGRWASARPLTVRELIPVVEAVAALHREGGVHGRIGADNLFRGSDGQLVLGDCGIGLPQGASASADTAALLAMLPDHVDLELTDAADLAEALGRVEAPRPPLVPLALAGAGAVLLLFGLGAFIGFRTDSEPAQTEPAVVVVEVPKTPDRLPDPVVEVEPLLVEPSPVVRPEPMALGTVTVQGDASRVRLQSSDGALHPPGPLPAGTYAIKAWFGGVEPISTGSIQVTAGQDSQIECSRAFQVCR